MPPLKPPATLQDLALGTTATCIRAKCVDIIWHHGDVTQRATIDHLTALNEQLVRQVPFKLLERLRKLEKLSYFVYLNATELHIEDEILDNTSMHRHLVSNVIPHMNNVTSLDLTNVEGNLDLFTAISVYCKEVRNLIVNTKLNLHKFDPFCERSEHWEVWLSLLTSCKKLEVIKDVSKLCFVFSEISSETKALLVRELPELKEFYCSGIPTRLLSPPPEDAGTYNLTRICIGIDFFQDPSGIQWLALHCPFIKHVDFFTVQYSDRENDIFRELSDSGIQIESLNFPYRPPKFTNAMDMYFVKKGYLLHSLILDYSQSSFFESISDNAMSCDDVIIISTCCLSLVRLTFLGNWYNGQALTQRQMEKTLFPKLEYFKFVYYKTTVIVPFLLEGLKHVKTLHCYVRTKTFFDTVEALRNRFKRLTDLELVLCIFSFGPGNVFPFLKRLFPVAMRWPNIRNIRINSFEKPSLMSYEEIESVDMLIRQIKEQNLDLTIACE